MNLDALNRWLTLIANFGVLIGIFVVAVELNQTQTAMDGEASTIRAQMSTNLIYNNLDLDVASLREKVLSGQQLTSSERARGLAWSNGMLRFFENLHYQRQIGILSDEIWEANLRGLGRICEEPLFQAVRPDWGNGEGTRGFRESFVDLVSEPCR